MGLAIYLEDADIMTVQSECHACGAIKTEQMRKEYFCAKITHNLTEMAASCGLYVPIWHPERSGLVKASQLISILREGLQNLIMDKEACQLLAPENGWGTYEHLLSFTQKYLEACEKYPESIIRVEP